jgi:hypothetical protein
MHEIGVLAAMLHWPLDVLLDLEHADRAFFLDAVQVAQPGDGRDG